GSAERLDIDLDSHVLKETDKLLRHYEAHDLPEFIRDLTEMANSNGIIYIKKEVNRADFEVFVENFDGPTEAAFTSGPAATHGAPAGAPVSVVTDHATHSADLNPTPPDDNRDAPVEVRVPAASYHGTHNTNSATPTPDAQLDVHAVAETHEPAENNLATPNATFAATTPDVHIDVAAAVVTPVPAVTDHATHSDQPADTHAAQPRPVVQTDAEYLARDHDPPAPDPGVPPDHPLAPKTLKAALTGPDADLWYEATHRQMQAFAHHRTMRPVAIGDVPDNTPFYRLGTTLTVKRNGVPKVRIYVVGSVINKERAMAPSTEPYEASTTHVRSSSPTASYDSLHLQAAHAAQYGLVIYQDDIDDFYLLQPNEAPYAARFPPGIMHYYEHLFQGTPPFNPHSHVMIVEGNLWGHPDAGRIAHEGFVPTILELGFRSTPMDAMMFVMPRPAPAATATLCLVVDDITIASDEAHAKEIMAAIAAQYRTKGAHPASDVCNIQYTRLVDGYSLDQNAYVQALLAKYLTPSTPTASTPLEPGFSAGPEDPLPQRERQTPPFDNPRVAIGELGFLRNTREDIVHAVSILATAVTAWTPKHDRNLARVFRYLKKHPRRPRVYRRKPFLPFALQDAYADCSFATELHPGTTGCAKSRSGILIRILDTVLIAVSARQTATALSTTEGEIAALCLATRRILPLRATIDLLKNTGIPTPPTVTWEDNLAAVAALRRRVVAGRPRHVRVAVSFIIPAVDAKQLTVREVRTHDQLADFLTRSLSHPLYKLALDRLSIRSSP
ncbi:MAG: reverse transcriptase domain-containing protein, partial [Bacteroidota bacterium]